MEEDTDSGSSNAPVQSNRGVICTAHTFYPLSVISSTSIENGASVFDFDISSQSAPFSIDADHTLLVLLVQVACDAP